MTRPMLYHDGVVGSSYHTLAHNVQCFSLSTLKNHGYSSTHWHHGISHDHQVLPVWAVLRILCAEYDDEGIGIRKKCKRGFFCLCNDDDDERLDQYYASNRVVDTESSCGDDEYIPT